MGRARVGIFLVKGNQPIRNNLAKGRQLVGMSLWILMKIILKSGFLMATGKQTQLDQEIHDRLKSAAKSILDAEKQIIWCCNATELDEIKED